MKKISLFILACFYCLPANALTITAAANCQYSNQAQTTIDCIVTADTGTFPYTAAANDNTDYGQQLWSDLNAGKYGSIGAYTLLDFPLQDVAGLIIRRE